MNEANSKSTGKKGWLVVILEGILVAKARLVVWNSLIGEAMLHELPARYLQIL